MTRYPPIEHHGVIGDLHTVALVALDGTIDWLCLPHFDSPSVFGALLDADRGGLFRIAAMSPEVRRRQMYLPDSNVLVTRFLTPEGVGEVVDFMPIRLDPGPKQAEEHRIVRIVRGVRGEIPVRLECRPAFDYGRARVRPSAAPFGCRFVGDGVALNLATTLPLVLDDDGATCDFVLRQGEDIPVVLSQAGDEAPFSKMMCWVALDRALRLSAERSFPADHSRWTATRDEIYLTIMERGFSRAKNSFVQRLDGEALDAAMLLAPLAKFVGPSDPRMLGTLDAISRELESDHLVHRYDPRLAPDGVDGGEGTFSICTFWLAEARARAGRLDEARLTFEKMLGDANHLGLYAEEISLTGEALGNFPQAFTHLGLISAAVNINRALEAHPTGRFLGPSGGR